MTTGRSGGTRPAVQPQTKKPFSSLAPRALCLGALLLAHLWPGVSLALNPSNSVYHYTCRLWARQNGLPANGVLAIAQSEDGYLWFGTPRGLVRYDGGEFRLFDILDLPEARSSIVSSLSPARRGGVWFGLERGAFGHCDGQKISLLGRDDWGGLNLFVQKIHEASDGQLWIGAERLAARVTKSNTFEAVLTTVATRRYNITAMHEDSGGRIWLGTAQQGLFHWKDGVLTRFNDPLLDELVIRSLAEDQEKRIWVGTQRGLLCYSATGERQPLPFPWYETRALLADREGAVWAGTSGGGLYRFYNGAQHFLRKTNGLADDFVTALAEDMEGSLWVGTRNGLNQLSDVKIPTLGIADGLTADVNVGVFPSRSNGLWVATGDGFTYFDGTARHYPAALGLRDPYVMGLLEARNGDVYLINASNDIEVFSGGRIAARYPNSSRPTALVEDHASVIAAAGGRLYRVGANFFKPYAFEGEASPVQWVFAMILAKDGGIWVAGHAGDIGITHIKDGKFKSWARNEGLPESKVLWLCEDTDGILWAGLETGIARLKDGRLSVITRANGLFDNIVNAIVADDHGTLWVDSSRGFFSVTRKSLNDFADGKTRRVYCQGYDGLDDVKSSEKSQQVSSGCKTPDGRIWFPTAQGVVCIDPARLARTPNRARVCVDRAAANGRNLDRGERLVPAGKGDLEFHYAGLSYIAPQKIQYRYMLEGHDPDWVNANGRRAAFYTNLKPGKYRFLVEARNENGPWSAAASWGVIELQPHFYQTVWFYALACVVLAGSAGGIYAWRVRRLTCRQLALESEVRNRTAELATANTTLQREVAEHERAEVELKKRTEALEKEIEERERMGREVERVHQQLLQTSRQAGMAEVATGVLHNVGNVLNSVNVSSTLIRERIAKSQAPTIARVAQLLRDHSADLGEFVTSNPKGRRIPAFLGQLATQVASEQQAALSELSALQKNIEHIKDIVAMQQSYAKAGGVLQEAVIAELVDEALKINESAFERSGIRVTCDYEKGLPIVVIDRHKVMQILVNVLRNARDACHESPRRDKRVTVRVAATEGVLHISVSDNGVGIPAENCVRIFNHGFTTKKEGHGFGLHSAALSAKEMGGKLTVRSDGPGFGACFTLELPLVAMSTRPPLPIANRAASKR